MSLLDLVRRANHNGVVAPPASDDWSDWYDTATPAGQRAMAVGAHRRAEKLAAASVEPDPEPTPDPRVEFHAKNHALLSRIIGRPAANQKD